MEGQFESFDLNGKFESRSDLLRRAFRSLRQQRADTRTIFTYALDQFEHKRGVAPFELQTIRSGAVKMPFSYASIAHAIVSARADRIHAEAITEVACLDDREGVAALRLRA